MATAPLRLDAALVELGYFTSREQAQRALLAGEVELNGRRDMKPGWRTTIRATPDGRRLFKGNTALAVAIRARAPYVSRGGLKLAAALDAFGLDPGGMCAADIGASTGGFTDCLLQRGTSRVYALDVGRGQLHNKLVRNERVVRIEGVNVRKLGPDALPERVDLATFDLSFISLKLALEPVMAHLKPGGQMLLMVKPQFEVGRGKVGKGGIVRDPELRSQAVAGIAEFAAGLGLIKKGECPSRLPGADGNQEVFLLLEVP